MEKEQHCKVIWSMSFIIEKGHEAYAVSIDIKHSINFTVFFHSCFVFWKMFGYTLNEKRALFGLVISRQKA